jgi:hypothetical protein
MVKQCDILQKYGVRSELAVEAYITIRGTMGRATMKWVRPGASTASPPAPPS